MRGAWGKALLGRRGFTLAEVLVVCVLSTIVSYAVYAFYTIGIDSHRRALARAESSSAVRFLYKLLDEKARGRSTGNYSSFMRRDGFAALPTLTSEILLAPLDGPNPALYRALGFDVAAHAGLAEGTLGVLLARAGPAAAGLAFRGNYVVEASREAGLLAPRATWYDFDRTPTRLYAATAIASGAGGLKLRATGMPATVEVALGAFRDFSATLPATPAAASTVGLEAANLQSMPVPLYTLYASFDTRTPVTVTPDAGTPPETVRQFFLVGANLLAGDGLMFYEETPDGSTVTHALYLRRPPAAEALLDADGNPLAEVRYALSRSAGGVRQVIDEALLTDVKALRFIYSDADGNEIVPLAGCWSWRAGAEVAGCAFELTTGGENAVTTRMAVTSWAP